MSYHLSSRQKALVCAFFVLAVHADAWTSASGRQVVRSYSGPRATGLTTSHDQLGRHVRDSIPAGWCWVVELSTADHTDTGLYVPLFGRLGLGVPIVVPTTKRRLQASL